MARTRRRTALGLAALALLLLVIWWWRRPAGDTAAPTGDGAKPDGPRVTWGPAPPLPPPVPVPLPDQPLPDVDEPPVLDEIILEKAEVCSGEENLITLRAHTENGTDAFLHYSIGGESGVQVPVVLWRDDDGRVNRPKILVAGRNNKSIVVDLPEYPVKDCQPPRAAFITARLLANSSHQFLLEAHVVDLGVKRDPAAKPFQPVEWLWSFGDGQSAVTNQPFVEHDYSDRPQDALYAELLISVEIKGAGGERLVGRKSLELLNPAAESLAVKGIVTLLLALDPRFPVLSADGIVDQGVRLWHNRPQPVTIDKVLRQRVRRGEEELPLEQVGVEAVLGTRQIPPGRGWSTRVRLDVNADPQIYGETYLIEGRTVEGWPVRGGFSVMRPPDRPTPENHTPVYDPVLTAKIKRARELLGQEFVTDEDLWRLEREGKFASLDVPPGDHPIPPAPAPPRGGTPSPPSPPPADPGRPPEGPTAPPSAEPEPAPPVVTRPKS